MAISDKEAYSQLDLPLGADREAITSRYKALTTKLSGSKSLEDCKKLEKVVQAYHKLIPPSNNRANIIIGSTNDRISSEAANLSVINAFQRKAEKKKEKKKRRKDKKNKDKSDDNNSNDNNKMLDSEGSSNEEEAEPFDISSAFVSYNGHKSATNGTTKKPDSISLANMSLEERQILARGMAVKGNEAASHNQHQKAVRLFTQAVEYDPSDHRFLGNRSFCYERLQYHDKAIQDADKAILLSPQWPKGYFRRGRALLGLSRFTEAEESFSRVLQLDPECEEARSEIALVQKQRLTEMGFTISQAEKAIAKYQQVQAALDALLLGEFQEASPHNGDASLRVYINAPPAQAAKKAAPQADALKMNSPKNPHGLTSLWVGNVLPEVTEKELQKLFSKYGQVSSVRQLKEKFCAFVNFTDSTSAGRAMNGLQGHAVCGQRLLIKFPDNPITATAPVGSGVRRRGGASSGNRQGL